VHKEKTEAITKIVRENRSLLRKETAEAWNSRKIAMRYYGRPDLEDLEDVYLDDFIADVKQNHQQLQAENPPLDERATDFSFDVFQRRLTEKAMYDFRLPRVGFELRNASPITAKVRMSVYIGERVLGMVHDRHGYYSGETAWSRPQPSVFWGNFSIPDECGSSSETLRLQATVEGTDSRGKTGALTRCFTYDRASGEWSLEPATWETLLKRAKEKGYKL
jgi:hypothetical protein